MQITTYGVDLAKRLFQVHWVEPDTGEVKRKMLTRAEMTAFFARRAAGLVAMEACGSAHHWGRALRALGHQVRLIPTQFVRPFVKSNKTDAADAQGIWEAAQRPEMRFVALKSELQQAVLGLHRVRAQLVKMRTMQANQVRGLLYEFGVVVPRSWRALLMQAGPILADSSRGRFLSSSALSSSASWRACVLLRAASSSLSARLALIVGRMSSVGALKRSLGLAH